MTYSHDITAAVGKYKEISKNRINLTTLAIMIKLFHYEFKTCGGNYRFKTHEIE